MGVAPGDCGATHTGSGDAMNTIRINGIALYTRRDSVRWLYGKHQSDMDFTLGGRSAASFNAPTIQGIEGDYVLVDESDYDSLVAELAAYGAVAVVIEPDIYLQAAHAGVTQAITATNRVFRVRLIQDPRLRLVDCFIHADTLEAVTSWSGSPGQAYDQLGPARQTMSAQGLTMLGNAAWDTFLREQSAGRSASDVVFLEAIMAVPLASRASIGLCVLNGVWSANPVSGSGVGVEFRSGDLVIRDTNQAAVNTLARAGGTYRVCVSCGNGKARVSVWENGANLIFTRAIAAPAADLVLGAVAGVYSGTAVLERWWVGGSA